MSGSVSAFGRGALVPLSGCVLDIYF